MANRNEMRELHIKMHGLINADSEYTIYHDESNNIRLLRLTENGLNITNPNCFVLGGILHKGSPHPLELDDLKCKLRLQKSAQEVKLKHLGKGTFPEILKSEKVQIFLQWLQEKELLIHFSIMDVIYWSIVDIIDSILTEAGHTQLLAINRELKNDLYEILRADLVRPLKILKNYSYPNVGKSQRVEFIKDINALLTERKSLIPDFNFQMLRGVLDMAVKLESLPYLDDEEPNILIESFSMLYLHQITLFQNSSHIFDTEKVIQKHLVSMNDEDNCNQTKNYRFADSASEDGIQISDIVIGLIGKCATFINQTNPQDIMATKSEFSKTQSNNLTMLNKLIDRSVSECPAFAHYTLSNQDMYRASVLFDG